jgi:lysophospholipase L1-like esterase
MQFINKVAGTYTFVAIQIFSVILLFTLLEFIVRIFTEEITPIDINASTLITDKSQAPFFQTHPFAAFTWIPNARFARQSVNKQGFVSTEDFEFIKHDNEIRIITLGGSSTVGNGNIDQETYPMQLQRMLRNKYPNKIITVINAAAGGYTTIESLGYLNSRLRYYQPDIIIVMHAWNDMYYATKSDEEISKWRDNFNLQAMWNPMASSIKEDPMPAHIQYLSWSQLYLHVMDRVKKRKVENADQIIAIEKKYPHAEKQADGSLQITPLPINATAILTYRNNLMLINDYCLNESISCYSILQPTLVIESSDRNSAKIKQAELMSALYHRFSYDDHIKLFNQMYDANIEVFSENYIIDAREISRSEDNFFDHIHQSPIGTNKLSEMVIEKIKHNEVFQN